jgi:hypothetical protein
MKTLIPRRLALGLLPALLTWSTTVLWADSNPQVPETTPTSDFILDNFNGTAYHKKTGLTWKRCVEGQNWSWDPGSEIGTCTGKWSLHNWSEALSLATDGWRLPNLKELLSIVEKRNWDKATNPTVFPNPPATWSATPYVLLPGHAWYVYTYDGRTNYIQRSFRQPVRLVRGGDYSLLSVAKAGTGSGTVTSNLPGIDCGKFCQGSFANEMFTAAEGGIILMATADDGSDFAGWEGCTALEGSPNECVLDSAADTRVTANFNLEVTVITVSIDIKPGSFPNSINPRSRGLIPVAILTTDTFDATTVDALSVEFGPAGATESHDRGHLEDVDGDGNLDLVLHFRTQDTGIQCGDTSASLTGNTFGGVAIRGSDSIRTVGCE